jgi:hypothetical protein
MPYKQILHVGGENLKTTTTKTPWPLVRKRTIPTDLPPLDEI